MIGDASDVDRGAILDCDVCIVGAGPAGITLARELGRTRLETIVLESGGTGIEQTIRPFFDDYYSIQFDNYAVADQYLEGAEAVPTEKQAAE